MAKVLFPGSFEPIHNGHLNMASLAASKFNCDVIFIPSKNSIWKTSSTSTKDKLEMVKLAIKDKDNFSVCTFEIDSKQDQTFTIDTVKYFKSLYKNEELYLLIGGDQVNKFHLWKDAEELSSLATIIFLKRPNEIFDNANIQKYKMVEISGSLIDESSSSIRDFKSFNVPFDVAEYILNNNLYGLSKIKQYYDDKRFEHAKRVALLAYKIGLANNVESAWKLCLAGIFHDIGKNCKNSLNIMEKEYPEFLDFPKSLYHQFVGAYIVESDFGVIDNGIIDAIKYHATGCKNMNYISKILYASDKIEPGRDFDSSELINEMMTNFEEGFLSVLKDNKNYFIKNGVDYSNRLTEECFNTFLK